MCLFGSNYPHACRPFPFSLSLSISLVVRCCVAVFPFISSPDSWFLMFLSVRVIVQPVLFVRAPAEALSALQHLPTIASHSRAFYLGFLHPDHSANGFLQQSPHTAGLARPSKSGERMETQGMSAGRRCCREKILLL